MKVIDTLPDDYQARKIAWIIRHAHRDGDKDEITDQGRAAAALLGQKLKNYKVNAIYSSPADRCVETARIITENIGRDIPIILDKHIAEQGVYITDMQKALDIYHKLGKEQYFRRLLTNENLPGHTRFSVAGEKISNFIKNNTTEPGITFFITHHFIIRMLNHFLRKLSYKDRLLKVEPLQGILVEI